MFAGNFFLNNAIAGAIELPTLIACVFLLHKVFYFIFKN